ncbi:hypothetical protein HELRODRAFT_183457 [Helobdella robusta]|uniref:Uncharacterized protein n=1 Tax=Helobdella robusta TaxID=6412 RepID=T1FJP6_HELRO|nr:hypothetical protein HELRODRAFT_183457 [Helobdella robusta]ESO11142.1 hypothetical protein HELRODRAFT_183457 [Helobdella robusta]
MNLRILAQLGSAWLSLAQLGSAWLGLAWNWMLSKVHSFRLKLPEEFIVKDQNGCDVTLRSFIQWRKMHAWLGLKLPEEFIMEDVRLRSFIQWQRIHAWLGYVLFFFLCNLALRGLAPVLEVNVGTGKHSTFCLVEWTTNDERWAVVGVSTFQMVVS